MQRPLGAPVNRQLNKSVTIGVVSMMKFPMDLVGWLSHHRRLGVHCSRRVSRLLLLELYARPVERLLCEPHLDAPPVEHVSVSR